VPTILALALNFPEILAASKVGVGSVFTECAHLFSESAAQDSDKVFLLVSCVAPFLTSNQPSEYAGTAFTMLKMMFGLEHEVEKLLGGRVNTLSNVFTLSHDMHEAFDRFAIWLDEEVPGQVCHCAPNFSSCMTRQSNPRKITILWKWLKMSAKRC
jgi:HNH endonuclease